VIVDAAKAKITGARMERGIYTATINEGEHEHRLTTQTGDVTVTIRQWN
jgi:ribosomal protein L13